MPIPIKKLQEELERIKLGQYPLIELRNLEKNLRMLIENSEKLGATGDATIYRGARETILQQIANQECTGLNKPRENYRMGL